MASAGLDTLAPELVYLILQEMATPTDLSALIHASAPFYRTFLLWRSTTLANVLRNAIHPDVLFDALAVLKAPEVKELQYQSDDARLKANVEFLEGYSSTRESTCYGDLRDLAVSIPLCRLYSSLDHFITDFSRKALNALSGRPGLDALSHLLGGCDELETSQIPNLLNTERARLHRAFFRFELCQRLFSWVGGLPGYLTLSRQVNESNLLLALLPPWEVEEVVCIHQYLTRVLENVFDEVEDEFVAAVLRESDENLSHIGEAGSLYSDTATSTPVSESMSTHHDFKESFQDYLARMDRSGLDHGLEFFGDNWKWKHTYRIDYLRAQGLQFLDDFIKLDKQDQTELCASVPSRYELWCKQVFHVVPVQDRLLQREINGERTGLESSLGGENIKDCNKGWLWAAGYQATVRYNIAANCDLRRFGYVFWDSKRLEECGLLETICKPEEVVSNDPTMLPRLLGRPSATVRLRGRKFQPQIFERLDFKPLRLGKLRRRRSRR
ncbi:hypothetical protein MMC27_000409 [Xylographa pallens]|nr:hypothetical protein [Xylographa pallens]